MRGIFRPFMIPLSFDLPLSSEGQPGRWPPFFPHCPHTPAIVITILDICRYDRIWPLRSLLGLRVVVSS